MVSTDLLHDYRWTIAAALVGLFLLSRYVMRRINARRDAQRRHAAETGQVQLITPEGYRRARKQFLMTLALLVVIVVVALMTQLG